MADLIDRLKGKVRWFDIRRGFGFITPEGGGDDVFVHKSSINAVGYSSLAVGDCVEFVVFESDDGRSKAVDVTGPDGAFIKSRRYFGGSCYRCGEVGHMAVDCKRVKGCTRLGPCYSCGEMGHLSKECPATPLSYRVNPSISDSILRISPSIPFYSDMLVNGDTENLINQLSEKKNLYKGEASSCEMEGRNWADLTRDVLSVIFKKIAAVEVITSAQYVCRPWRQFSKEPELWRCIHMINQAGRLSSCDLESIAMIAVDRSDGCVEEFYAEFFGTDVLMGYLAGRATQLQCLRLSAVHQMTDMALVQAVRRFQRLEELEISNCCFSDRIVELVGLACPQLKNFILFRPYKSKSDYEFLASDFADDKVAMAIANNMPQLRRLKLLEKCVTNAGLSAILNSCPHLEQLDIGGCLNVEIDENMQKKCAKIKDLILPTDFTYDYRDYDTSSDELDMFAEAFVPTVFESEFDYQYDDYAYYDHDFFDVSPHNIF